MMNVKFITWERVNESLFKVVIERQQTNEVPTYADFQSAIDALLGFGWKVKDQISEISSASGRTYNRLLLEVQAEEVPATDIEAIDYFGKISAKVYRNSNDDSLWTVKANPDGSESLVRNELPDSQQILGEIAVENPEDEVVDSIEPDVYEGDYVSFIDSDNEIKCGFVANDLDEQSQYVVTKDGEAVEIDNPNQYLDVVASTHPVLIKAFDESDVKSAEEDAIKVAKKFFNDSELMKSLNTLLNRDDLVSKIEAEALAIVGS